MKTTQSTTTKPVLVMITDFLAIYTVKGETFTSELLDDMDGCVYFQHNNKCHYLPQIFQPVQPI